MTTRFYTDARAKFGKVRATPQGGIEVPAYPTRTGVLTYYRDGKAVRELRHPDDVFKAESLATMKGASLTIRHPSTPSGVVTPEDWKALSVGTVADDVKQDPTQKGFVSATLRIQDAAAIAQIAAGELIELSSGYYADSIPESGVYQGIAYDSRQVNIRYNHVALLPRGEGRAGPDVALRLDSSDSCYLTGMDFEKLYAELKALYEARGKELEAAVSAHSADKKRADSLEAERDALKEKLAAAPKNLELAVSERVQLVDSARKVLGQTYDFLGKSPRQIMEEAIAKAAPNGVKLDSKSDDYIRARFDSVVESYEASRAATGQAARVLQDSYTPEKDIVAEARAAMIARTSRNSHGSK